MSTALYRRYRPETFADVIGQEHVTEPLMQALRSGRVNHAYLFSGPRGCGKTTSARILARCLNCEQGPTPTPCGECDSCVALARGGAGSVDVIEIDAASHGGVDDARDLRERASFGPAQSRYKIYIIDEAHMVTPQGFNALLKIVEEPPEHVKFVFATTEPEKVIGTIRSRTHHYPFRLVPPARLQDYMEQLCAAEGVALEPGVLSFVVRAGGGSVRDSLSVLDQLIAGSDERGLTYEGAAALLGFTDDELLDRAVTAFGAGDAGGVFTVIDSVIETGLDPRRFVEDLLERFRDLIVIAAAPEGAAAILRGLPGDQIERMRQQSGVFGPASLSRAADIINAGLTEMTGATSPRVQLEIIAARVLLPAAAGESGYAARLDRLERRLDVGGVPTGEGGGPRSEDAAPARGDAPRQAAVPQRPAPGPQQDAPIAQAAPAAATTGRGPDHAVTPHESAPRAPAPQGRASEPRPTAHDVSAHEAAGPAPAAADSQPPTPEQQTGARPDRGEPPAEAPEQPAADEPAGAAATSSHIDVEALRRAWPDVLGRIYQMRRATWTFLSEHAQVLSYDGQRLVLGIATTGLANAFRNGSHAEVVRQALIDALGVDARVEGVPHQQSGQPPAGGGSQATYSPPPQSASAPPAAGRGGPTGPGEPRAQAAPADDMGVPAPAGGPSGADWGSTPASASSAPSWATAGPATGSEQASSPPSPPAPEPRAPREPDDASVSDDDEDIVDAGAAGPAVIERILGGAVIREE
ncbi:DNA polymerase III subunit gamma and tau [Janibacter cremeus]|uniref:DNA polymerase III subunit gamma and tau n=1 Tax=Janibacter cremeus TaxID=1285192 RepID=UPI0023F61CB5|nr:DNA polymerase III subunit gamma and tau [Janibacter cremeus]WEV76842.1 DNA polymerase III subunit gamma and tau [Janibacter cremeus]